MHGFKRFWVMFIARNREFFRDKAGFGWNILFPFFLIAGFGIIFGAKEQNFYKVGVFPAPAVIDSRAALDLPEPFKTMDFMSYAGFTDESEGLEKLRHHRIDLLIKLDGAPYQYWVSETSSKSRIVEKLFLASVTPEGKEPLPVIKQLIQGRSIRYIDWLFPGILGMNMMFSALWGVGYIVVRYRKNGVLKRLKATPLTAFEYLSAQLISRLCVLMSSLAIVWAGCHLIFSFQVQGSYLTLFWVFLAGSLNLIALGLLLASRGISEEFVSGILNFISWPMMFLSEVWFSLEGAPEWIRQVAQVFPLTHLLKAARAVINDGSTLLDLRLEMAVMLASTLLLISLAAMLFSWNK